jgi:NAD+ kinase
MQAIGILHHPRIPASRPLAQEVYDWLAAQNKAVWMASTWEMAGMQARIEASSLLVVLGGDGSLLRVARVSTPFGIPLFGINLGKVGFLSEAQPEEWQQKLGRVLTGDYWTEKRLMLNAALHRNGRVVDTFTALNDLVVGRGAQARVVRFQLSVDGDLVTTYTADALIVATPTGSTAYAMAAGGPLLPPQLPNLVVLPVAAHLSFDRSLILHETAEIAIKVNMDHEAYITPDGRHGIAVEDGDVVVIKKDDYCCTFARVESAGYFYRRLMARLGHIRQD